MQIQTPQLMQMTLDTFRAKLSEFYTGQIDQATAINVLELQKLTSGWETEVYSFDVAYSLKKENKREHLILRTFPGTGGTKKATYEFALMKGLAEQNYPVPRVHHLVAEETPIGYPFIIMERLLGGALTKVMEAAPAEEQQQLKALFMKCFAELHQLDWQTIVPNSSRYELNSQSEYIEKPLHAMRRTVTRHQIDEFMEVVEWLENRVAMVPTEGLSLVHYDYHLGNIVLSEDKKPFVIDWSVSRVTDYRIDLGWTLLLESTYEAYENRDILLNAYQTFRNSYVTNIEFFEVVAALRRLVVMAISFSGEDDVVATRPEVVEIMKGYTDHVNGVIRILKDRTGITLHEFEATVSKASTDFKRDKQ